MPKKFLFIGSYEDKPEATTLKYLIRGHNISALWQSPGTVAEVAYHCKRNNIDAVLTTNEQFLNKLVDIPEGTAKISDFAGSLIDISIPNIPKVECLVLNPLPQLYTVRHGKFLANRFISKLTAPEKWIDPLVGFKWELGTPDVLESFYEELDHGSFLVCDTETLKHNLTFSCVGYTIVHRDFSHRTVVIPFDSLFNLGYIRKINLHPISKCFQNGLYDNSYFLRFGAPVKNWTLDTLHLFHSWYSELPKTLGFITSFTLRKWPFWKDLAKINDLESHYEYNARDCFGTAAALITLLKQMPPWAIKNYTDFEFPMVFPCLYCQMEGWKIDWEKFKELKSKEAGRLELMDSSLEKMTRVQNFNANSPVQVKTLLQLCGIKNPESTDKKHLAKYKFENPLVGRFVEKIDNRRKAKKAFGTYYVEEKLWSPDNPKYTRFLYGISPAKTDTGRLGSDNHPFWIGANAQNIPFYAKGMYVSDDGYLLGEPDCAQSEARCVGYESEDGNLIETVESGKDYHAVNVERFFGIAYEQIVTPQGKVINKPVRDLSKRVNHGANYNMGAAVLVDTMGLEAIFEAKKILNLPAKWGALDVAKFLLHKYELAYPLVKSKWYDEIKYAVESTHMLVSSLGWTRYCFGNPSKNKQDLNAYVAHVPQNLSVQIINKGFYKALDFQRKHWPNFRLKAQIHDSTPFQYKEGREDIAHEYAKLLECPVLVKGRTMLIPVGLKFGAKQWSGIE